MSFLLAFLGFALLIILHEFGHFVVAKWTGMRVERFFLFFPPKLFSVKRGETEYGVGAIPLGGFVKITGMNPDELRARGSAGARIASAEREEDNTPAGLLNKIEAAGQEEDEDDGLPPEVMKRAYYNQPVWKRIAVIGAGPAVNIVLAFVILFALALGATQPTSLAVGQIESGSPAENALRSGDEPVSVDGIKPTQGGARPSDTQLADRAETLADQVNTHKCANAQTDNCRAATPATIVVRRDGELVTLQIHPFYDADADRYRIGFAFEGAESVPENLSVTEAAGRSATTMVDVTTRTVSTFARLFNEEQRKEVSGVVGVSSVAHEAIEFDTRLALGLLALVSLSLGIINLFPFLPLDGGHIFWSLVEKVRGRPVAFSTMERAGALGFVLIMFLFLIGLSNDIGRLTGEGFDVR
ncbi:MAG: RIP metalloprotease [Actinomycetota bacterium]|nr:RIP metalloprotease [Actinomycetota bacterium]